MTATEIKRIFDYLKIANDDILTTVSVYEKRKEKHSIGGTSRDIYTMKIEALYSCKVKIMEAIEELAKAQ